MHLSPQLLKLGKPQCVMIGVYFLRIICMDVKKTRDTLKIFEVLNNHGAEVSTLGHFSPYI